MIATAFLAWQRTWTYAGKDIVLCDYHAARAALETRELDKKHIETLYIMKMKWTGAQREKS